MKTIKNIASTALLLGVTLVACTQQQVPLNSGYWEVLDGDSLVQDPDFTTLYGRECLHLPGGQVAYFKDNSFRDFSMEMDVAGIYMPGIGFRGTDKQNYEYLYLRVLSDNQGDALQYLPICNGGFSWQLYNYPLYETKASYPKRYLCSVFGVVESGETDDKVNEQVKEYFRSGGIELSDALYIMPAGPATWKVIDTKNLSLHYLTQTGDSLRIYNGLEWIHLKLEVYGKQARLFVEDLHEPVLVIDELRLEKKGGLISLRNFTVDSYFANIRIEPIDRMEGYNPKEAEVTAPGQLSHWELSGKFGRDYGNLQEKIDSVTSLAGQWKTIQSESNGLINLSRYFDVTEGTAILRTHVESPADQQVKLLFDYSARLAISLNSEVVFSDSLRIRENEGRVIDGEEEIELQLSKGTNELLFILTSDAYRQNWGMIARIPGLNAAKPAEPVASEKP